MSYFDLEKQISKRQTSATTSSKSGYLALEKKVSPIVESNKLRRQEEEKEKEKKKQDEIIKQQEAISSFQSRQQEIQQKVEKGNIFQKIGGYYQSAKQALGFGETLPEIQGGSQMYQVKRNAQLSEQDYNKRFLARGSQAIINWGNEKKETIKKSEEERGKFGTVIEAGKGSVKNLGELASGTGKLALEFSPLTGMSGIRKLTRFVGGQSVDEYVDRNTPEYQKKVDAFVDDIGILNYKAKYNNEIQKTGGEVAEIGSWFIPITRIGKVSKIEKAISEIPKVARILNSTPKVVKVGEKLMYEVSKDVVDVTLLDAIRGKDWETIKEDAKMAGIGGGVLRVAGSAIAPALKAAKNKRLLSQVEKSIPDMSAEEKEIAQQLAGEGKTIDDIATDIFAKREEEGIDIYKGMDEVDEGAVAKADAPEAPKMPVEPIKPKVEVKTPVKEKVDTEPLHLQEGVKPKVSKIAKSIEQKMKDTGMIDEDIEKATFEGITVKGQAEEAAKILQDKQLVDDIITGKKPLSEKVRPSTFIKAVEDEALRTGDAKTMEKLAKSKIAGETSYSAQDLRMAAERDPDSAVIKMREIIKAREEALKKRLKKDVSINQVKKATEKEIKGKIKKSTKATWSSFIEDIKC